MRDLNLFALGARWDSWGKVITLLRLTSTGPSVLWIANELVLHSRRLTRIVATVQRYVYRELIRGTIQEEIWHSPGTRIA